MTKDWINLIESADSLEKLETLRLEILGKKGFLTQEFTKLKDIPNEEKKEFAANLNKQKTLYQNTLDTKKRVFGNTKTKRAVKS